mmetsp:Transcript_21585/g.38293  ORF Transcript_21585/g.38293 Transcript_21585/m.38293 type:complete len:170 (-) Transcript_21585:241-750(-)
MRTKKRHGKSWICEIPKANAVGCCCLVCVGVLLVLLEITAPAAQIQPKIEDLKYPLFADEEAWENEFARLRKKEIYYENKHRDVGTELYNKDNMTKYLDKGKKNVDGKYKDPYVQKLSEEIQEIHERFSKTHDEAKTAAKEAIKHALKRPSGKNQIPLPFPDYREAMFD